MDKYTLYAAIGELADDLLLDAEQIIQTNGRRSAARHKRSAALIAVAAAIAILGSTAAIAASFGYDMAYIFNQVAGGFAHSIGPEQSPDPAVLQEELNEGQWFYLNGAHIAVIVPESPVKILLSSDAGETWQEATVTGSESWEFLGEQREETQYWGGYIGFFSERGGYLVLTSGVSMNHQKLRIYLTADGGTTWSEIGNPCEQHISVLTGAGFASEQVGFISYRYFEDAGPDIWWTKDGGETWSRLEVTIPSAYQNCCFTPLSPSFDGEEGTYPILASGEDGEETICMYSHDGGLSWSFEQTASAGSH